MFLVNDDGYAEVLNCGLECPVAGAVATCLDSAIS
jgi:hypothetical protein